MTKERNKSVLVGFTQRRKIGKAEKITRITVAEGDTSTSGQINGPKSLLKPIFEKMRESAAKNGKKFLANDADES